MQISSGHITGMSLSRSRSYAGEKQTLPPECPTLSSPPVIHSPFTCPENTRWANPSYSLLFAPSRRSILFFYCFSGRHNAVIGWHIVACLSPRFLLITLLPWHFAKLLSKGQNSREEHQSSWFDTSICLSFRRRGQFCQKENCQTQSTACIPSNRWNTNAFIYKVKITFSQWNI